MIWVDGSRRCSCMSFDAQTEVHRPIAARQRRLLLARLPFALDNNGLDGYCVLEQHINQAATLRRHLWLYPGTSGAYDSVACCCVLRIWSEASVTQLGQQFAAQERIFGERLLHLDRAAVLPRTRIPIASAAIMSCWSTIMIGFNSRWKRTLSYTLASYTFQAFRVSYMTLGFPPSPAIID